MALALQTVVERRRDQQAEVRLGLAAAGGEPNDVYDFCLLLGVDDAMEVCQEETELEGPPARVLAGGGNGHCPVHQPEGALQPLVATQSFDPLRDAG